MHELDEVIIKHFGVKGMHWGVRRNSKGSGRTKGGKSSGKAHKVDNHPSVVKYGKQSIRKGRKIRAQLDASHVDVKTGEYTHKGPVAKTVRVVDKVMNLAGTVLVGATI